MRLTHANDNSRNAFVHHKIRARAMAVGAQPKTFDGVEEFCNRINRLQSKTDSELSKMGLDRTEIGAHVLQKLIN